MKLLSRIIMMISILSLVFMGNGAYATSSCPPGFTGPNSDNVCLSTTIYSCTTKSNNQVQIDNTNTQVAVSGVATGSSTLSGSVTNENGTTFAVTVTNSAADGQSICSVVATAPPVDSGGSGGGGGSEAPAPPSARAEAGGRGAGAEVVAPASATPAILPYTSGDDGGSAILATFVLLGSLAALAGLLRLAIGRRHT